MIVSNAGLTYSMIPSRSVMMIASAVCSTAFDSRTSSACCRICSVMSVRSARYRSGWPSTSSGTIVVSTQKWRPSFARLQIRPRQTRPAVMVSHISLKNSSGWNPEFSTRCVWPSSSSLPYPLTSANFSFV